MKKMTKKDRFVTGYEYGKQAFADGKKAACQDAPFMELLKDSAEFSRDLLEGWNRGWHTANVNAPDGVIR